MKAAFNFIYRLANNEGVTANERFWGLVMIPVWAYALILVLAALFNKEFSPWL